MCDRHPYARQLLTPWPLDDPRLRPEQVRRLVFVVNLVAVLVLSFFAYWGITIVLFVSCGALRCGASYETLLLASLICLGAAAVWLAIKERRDEG